jgi:cytochrome P450
VNVLTLHRDEVRHSYYAQNLRTLPFFDAALQCWVVTDPKHSEAILALPDLGPADYVGAYERLEERGPQGFPNLRFALKNIPFSLIGSDHLKSRQIIGKLISARRAHVASVLPELVEAAVAVLDRPGEVELMREMLTPLVTRFVGEVAGLDTSDPAPFRDSSVVFDRMMGLKKRIRMEESVGDLRANIRSSVGEDITDEEEGARLALCILGHDATLGMIGESLHWILNEHSGRRFSDIPYPSFPPATGVPYIERTITAPFQFCGLAFRPGERIRFLFQALTYSTNSSDHAHIFGYGLHTCLGKQLSLDLWKEFTAALSRRPQAFELREYAVRTDDYVFACPEKILIGLRA